MGEADTLAGKRHILDTLTVVIERIKAEVSDVALSSCGYQR
jgi:hypothetical protein